MARRPDCRGSRLSRSARTRRTRTHRMKMKSAAHFENGNGSGSKRPVLITGGSGFIGSNLAHRLLSNGERVLLFDNFSRSGVEQNLDWLCETHGDAVQIEIADVRDAH